jgi:hypothetical protein
MRKATGSPASVTPGLGGQVEQLLGHVAAKALAEIPADADVGPPPDPVDLGRLAAPYRTVVIEPLARSKGSPA